MDGEDVDDIPVQVECLEPPVNAVRPKWKHIRRRIEPTNYGGWENRTEREFGNWLDETETPAATEINRNDALLRFTLFIAGTVWGMLLVKLLLQK